MDTHRPPPLVDYNYKQEQSRLNEKMDDLKLLVDKKRAEVVSQDVSGLSDRIKTISDAVTQLRLDLNQRATEANEKVKVTKDELIQRTTQIEISVAVVTKTIDAAINDLNNLKKVTDEDRARVNVVVSDLKIVKDQVGGMQAQIDDIKLMWPDYKFLIKVRKFELEHQNGVVK
jgi:septation ring formation regulator EzrA